MAQLEAAIGIGSLASQFRDTSPKELRRALQGLTPERRKAIGGGVLQAVMEPTREATRAVVAVTATEGGLPDQPEQAPKLYSFAEARNYLSKEDINLSRLKVGGGTLDEMNANAVLEAEVKSAVRWGSVDKKGADGYGAALESAKVSEPDLQALVAQLKANPDLGQRIVLEVDNMTPEQAWEKLEGQIDRTYVWKRFSRYQRVDPATRQPLEGQRPSGKAGILFTPDQMNLPRDLRNISANSQLERMTNGQRYMGPVGWMKLLGQDIDRALSALYSDEALDLDNLAPDAYKVLINLALLDRRIDPYLLDTVTGTQFPDFRLDGDANGAVPDLYFSPLPVLRPVILSTYYPASPNGDLGGRPVLGSFLS